MGRKLFDNSLFAEEPMTAFRRANVGITARLLGTCCMGGASASTKSPAGSKPLAVGGWEDCPAFDLDPVSSRQASAVASIITQGLGVTEADDIPTHYRLQSQQVPVGEAEQAQRDTDGGRPALVTRAVAVSSLSSPQAPVAAASTPPTSLPSALTGPGGGRGCSKLFIDAAEADIDCTPTLAPVVASARAISTAVQHGQQQGQEQTHDIAADMYNSDNDSLPAAESPLAQPHPRERQHMQHRVALRLLERRGVLPEGRTSASGCGTGSAGSASASGGACSPTSTDGGASSGGAGGSSSGGGGASGSGLLPVSPNSVRRNTEYYSALSSPVVLTPEGGGGASIETAVQVDERLCLQEREEDDPLDFRSAGYRLSAPGLGARAVGRGGSPWAGGGAAAAARSGGCGSVADEGGEGDLHLRMRGSDFGGVMGGTIPEGVFVRARARAAGGRFEGGGTPRSAVVVPAGPCDGDDNSFAVGEVRTPRPGAPQPAWSAAGGRVELSLEEKEWLFGQPGGIGGLAPVMALGEGGEGLVDLVRLDLPCRTLHLARKATRTCLPAFALTASGAGPAAAAAAAVLGVRSQKVSYRFPFEFFDREVKAMKAVKESGFVIRFQAAAYDHEAGQGFILMEAAPYGTLEDLHAALCRSQMQPMQRQRPALLQRAFAKFNFKSSAPPSLASAAAAASTTSACTPRGGAPLAPHSPASGINDRPSLPRPPPAGGIGSCGGAALELDRERERLSCCSTASNVAGGGGGGSYLAHAPTPSLVAANSVCGSGGPMQFAALGSALMSTRALRYYGACMLQALVALHEAGYVYRDLKLSNVLVCEGGRVRLTDFGAATTSLHDHPGLFSGAAGTRAYLAPEVLPWLEAGTGGGRAKRSSGSGGAAGGPEPYTITVDSWTWGLVMVELATGWSLKELTQRIIRRVCAPRGGEPPDLPPDCGLPPALRQLLLEHVLVRDPRERWPAARIRGHRFFEGLAWEGLAEVEGPHAHLFTRGSTSAGVVDGPDAVAAAMLEGEVLAGGRQRGSRPSALAVGGGNGGNGDRESGGESHGNVVVPFGPRPSGLSSSRPSYAGGPPSPLTPGMLSPGSVLTSPIGAGGGARLSSSGFASPSGGRPSGAISPVLSASGGRPSGSRPSSTISPGARGGRPSGTGLVSPGLAAGGVRQSFSSVKGGPMIGSMVVGPPGTPTPSGTGPMGLAAPGTVGSGDSISRRRQTLQGLSATSRLSSGSFRQSSSTAPGSDPPPPVSPPPLFSMPQAFDIAAVE